MKRIFFTFLFTLTVVISSAQTYMSPMGDFPFILSANFGEFRANHFHSGIDIKTGGAIGKKIYAVADGYISRIGVSTGGFGKALYIAHPNGETSVYAHLDGFSSKIDSLVKSKQYASESFVQNIFFNPGEIMVKKGEVIAISGNSGSSGGPHLHFELREGSYQIPFNPVAANIYKVDDKVSPYIYTLRYVSIDTLNGIPLHNQVASYSAVKEKENYVIKSNQSVTVSDYGYFTIEVSDRQSNTQNTMGIYKIDANINGNPFYSMTIDKFSFDNTRYVNAVSFYSESKKQKNDVVALFILPNNKLGFYDKRLTNGLLKIEDTLKHKAEIVVWDDSGNSSILLFTFKKGNVDKKQTAAGLPVYWNKDFAYDQDGLFVEIRAGSLYESTFLDISKAGSSSYSPVYAVHNTDTPLQKAIKISISADALPSNLHSKALVATEVSGKTRSAGGKYSNGAVTTSISSFGRYFIAVDTVKPTIVALDADNADLSAKKSLSFKIGDNLSGIDLWKVTIDGKWALFDYDPKVSRITHKFDYTRFKKGVTHAVVVTVIDAKGNKNTLNRSYKW